jgi:hypothetical protein
MLPVLLDVCVWEADAVTVADCVDEGVVRWL